jgi:hypothetical protein
VKLTFYKEDKIDFTKKRDTKKYIREGTNLFLIHEKVTRTIATVIASPSGSRNTHSSIDPVIIK